MNRIMIKPYYQASHLTFLVMVGLILLPLTIQSEQIYKYIDENGVVSYGAKPPEGAKKVKEMEVKAEGSPLSASERKRKIEKFRSQHHRNMLQDKRSSEAADKKRQGLNAAKREVAAKKEALEKAKQPQAGDRQAYKKAGGGAGSRLRPQYHARIKRLEKELAEASKRLRDIMRNQ